MTAYALVRVLASCLAAGVAVLVVSLMAVPARVDTPGGGEPTTVDTRSAQGSDRVARLLAEHDCWSGAAPPGAPIPGHAVVTLPGQRPRLVAGDVGFGIWLDGDPGVLHGFCP